MMTQLQKETYIGAAIWFESALSSTSLTATGTVS